MLKVFFGYDKDAIRGIDTWFNHIYSPEWFDDEDVKQIVKDIDKSDVLSPYVVVSPVLGSIPVTQISGGAKTLIALLKMDESLIDLITIGPNCQEWLSKIAAKKDIEVTLSGYDIDFEGLPIEGICLNDNSEFHNSKEWLLKMVHFVEEGER